MFVSKEPNMKLNKKSGIYANSTGSCTFDPIKIEAHSYTWWRFVAVIDGLVIFNNYSYSISTTKHQAKVARMMEDLGIKIDLFLPLRRGITYNSLAELILEAEEGLCDSFFNEELNKQDRYERAKERRQTAKAQAVLTLTLVV